MILLELFSEFFLVGLLAVGGGLATIPFLQDMGQRTGWFTACELANMIAVSEATPGPIGVNMATYVGFEVGGPLGAVTATIGLITPCVIIILLITLILKKFKESKYIKFLFYGLRAASTALVAAAGWTVFQMAIVINGPAMASKINWTAAAIAAVVLLLTNLKYTAKIHPAAWLALSAVAGALLDI